MTRPALIHGGVSVGGIIGDISEVVQGYIGSYIKDWVPSILARSCF